MSSAGKDKKTSNKRKTDASESSVKKKNAKTSEDKSDTDEKKAPPKRTADDIMSDLVRAEDDLHTEMTKIPAVDESSGDEKTIQKQKRKRVREVKAVTVAWEKKHAALLHEHSRLKSPEFAKALDDSLKANEEFKAAVDAVRAKNGSISEYAAIQTVYSEADEKASKLVSPWNTDTMLVEHCGDLIELSVTAAQKLKTMPADAYLFSSEHAVNETKAFLEHTFANSAWRRAHEWDYRGMAVSTIVKAFTASTGKIVRGADRAYTDVDDEDGSSGPEDE